MIIDAKDQVLGRVATYAAKKALLGESISIINCEFAIISGDKKKVLAEHLRRRKMGTPKGPYYHRSADRVVRRTVRGMLPYKQPKGKEAFKRVLCYNKVPDALKDQKSVMITGAHKSKLPNLKFIKVGEICKGLGGK